MTYARFFLKSCLDGYNMHYRGPKTASNYSFCNHSGGILTTGHRVTEENVFFWREDIMLPYQGAGNYSKGQLNHELSSYSSYFAIGRTRVQHGLKKKKKKKRQEQHALRFNNCPCGTAHVVHANPIPQPPHSSAHCHRHSRPLEVT